MKRTLNFDKIKNRINSTPTPSKEALKNIFPIDWDEDVLTGRSKVIIKESFPIDKTDIGITIQYEKNL